MAHPLPLQYRSEPGEAPVLSVDGAFGAPGLNLSHWPGNTTPPALKHELSTGIALNFSALPADERATFLEGLTALVNNHFDTDGVLALFAVSHPEVALAHRERLIEWARAGDFFDATSEEAFCADFVITAYCDPERSPIAERLQGLTETERYRVATEALFAALPTWLNDGLDSQQALFTKALERFREDLSTLAGLNAVPIVHFDLTMWESPAPVPQLPGRHALFGCSQSDRVLWLAPTVGGTHARLLISTLSWFDLPKRKSLPRPELEAMAGALNALEGTHPDDPLAWRFQSPQTASPELWFGRAGLPLFVSDSSEYLGASSLPAPVIKAQILEGLRKAWVFENEADTSDIDDIFAV